MHLHDASQAAEPFLCGVEYRNISTNFGAATQRSVEFFDRATSRILAPSSLPRW